MSHYFSKSFLITSINIWKNFSFPRKSVFLELRSRYQVLVYVVVLVNQQQIFPSSEGGYAWGSICMTDTDQTIGPKRDASHE